MVSGNQAAVIQMPGFGLAGHGTDSRALGLT